MSVEASTWAWKQDLPASRKLILLALADHADKAGVCWPSNETLMEKAGVSQATLYRALGDLRKDGLLSDGTKGDHADKTWILKMRTEADSVSHSENEDSHNEKRSNKEPSGTTNNKGEWEGRKVNRKPVTEDEWLVAEQVVGAFNDAAGTTFTVAANFVPVVGRIRERPQYTPGHHQRIILANLAEPWWDGPPSLKVIYGNPGIFETSIERARAFEANGGKTTETPKQKQARELEEETQRKIDRGT